MFVLSRQGTAVSQAVAMLVTSALVVWTFSVYTFAQAANVTDVSDTLSDSDISAVSDHTIAFTVPTGSAGVEAGETITVTFPAGFNMGSVAFGDVDLEVNTVDETLAGTPSGATWGAAVAGQVLTITSGSATIDADDDVVIKIGTNADGGTNQITNPGSGGSYEIDITSGTGANGDAGHTRVAILDNVDVTAQVDTTFDFVVSGVNTIGASVNGTSTSATSSATEIPFGTLSAGVVETIAQRLNVTTNAIGGFVVTVEQDQNLLSSTGADIDGFIDGAYTNTPAAWQAPGNNISDEDTWGHWGLTSEDSDLNTDEFGSDLWVAASTTPREIFSHDGPSDGTTDDVGSTTVGYQIEISPLQEAADDYSTTLTYIATPTF
ncbi:MAG: hypothetical protein R3B69_00275 [Candidatus Paceibacterota bacterium]